MNELNHDLTNAKLENGHGVSHGPSPNRGASIPDIVALGPNSQSQSKWQAEQRIDRTSQVKIVKVSHMRYQHPDLDEITTFLEGKAPMILVELVVYGDFGMHVVKKTATKRWYRGYGADQFVYFAQEGPMQYLGGAFEVESYEELEKVIKIPGAECIGNGIERMDDAPGGGYIATIRDPEGFLVNFVFGQTPAEVGKLPEKLIVNDESTKPRIRKFQRFEPGPAAVHKLGHFGLCVKDFDAQMSFYVRNFNIIPSDLLYVPISSKTGGEPSRKVVAMFGHIDRGTDYVDHHTMFLSTLVPGGEPHVHHASFEIHDFDTQYLGHQWLAKKDYKSVWGVGRHILGSQIFDYWWDTTGFMIEHYCDGDLVNEETPVGYLEAGDESLAVWGPEVPRAFLD